MKKEVIFTGIGGQGIVKSAVLLAEAGMLAGLYAAQTARYDAAARGAITEGETILSSEVIDFPHVHDGDIHASFNLAAFEKYNKYLKADGVVIYDSSIFVPAEDSKGSKMPIAATELSLEKFNMPGLANIIMLGAISHLFKEIEKRHFINAIETGFKRYIKENLQAFALGRELASR